ncbi:transposable element Tcb1 transposase [Trichonephila clavipes]|uniref:Transposable element Tcb1 transposase n=1 Tax=Trichonephila clavipes TaxID=2585209 RepID=A0A8X6V6X5_TRICX|nr:transposable element Tcb1 transposase [Trichonephila clavipes]
MVVGADLRAAIERLMMPHMCSNELRYKDLVLVPLSCKSASIKHKKVGMPAYHDTFPDHETTSTTYLYSIFDTVRGHGNRVVKVEQLRRLRGPIPLDFKYQITVFSRCCCPFSVLTRQIGSRVGRNRETVMWICDRWMQEGTTDRRGRSHPPQCTISLSARTIRRHLQQSGLSARRPLLGLHLTQNHRRLRCHWCDERRMWVAEWNEVVLTDESRICLQHHDGRIRVWRHCVERMLNSCVMHHHTGSAPGIMVWGGIGYHSRTPLVRIAGTLNSQHYFSEVLEPAVLPYLQGLAAAIFQQDSDHT